MSDSTTASDRRMPHHRAATPSARELRELHDLPEPRPRRTDWVVLWPFTVCLPLDSHYCCVHSQPH